MILNYFEQKIRVVTEINEFLQMIKLKYCPIIKIEEELNQLVDYNVMVNIDVQLNREQFDDSYRRIVIHGGNKKETYITGLEKILNFEKKVYIEKLNSLIIINLKNKKIECTGSNLNLLLKALDLVIIELFYRTRELMHGSVHFHASGISVKDNEAILFIGHKNAGKTTFMTESVMKRKMKYICNDNCFIEYKNNDLIVIPWFEDIKLKKSTMKKYDIVDKAFENCEISPDNNKLYIPLSLIKSKMKFDLQLNVTLKKIVLLEYKDFESSIEIGWSNEWNRYLLENTKLPHDAEHYEFLGLFDEFGVERFDIYQQSIEIMKNKVEFIHLTYNEDSFQDMYEKLF